MATPETSLTNPCRRYTQPVVQTQPGQDFKIVEVPLVEDPKGKWVKWEDFAKLDADAAGVQAELASVKLERHQLRNELTAAGLENERLREVIARCYMRMQGADVPRAPWHWEVCTTLDNTGIPSSNEPAKLPTEAEIDAAFPAVAAGVIAEMQHYSKLSPKEFAELAWSTLIDPAWRHTTMLYELCTRASPEWVQERLAATPSEPLPVASFPVADLVKKLRDMDAWALDCGCARYAGEVADELERRDSQVKYEPVMGQCHQDEVASKCRLAESGAPRGEAGNRASPLVSPQTSLKSGADLCAVCDGVFIDHRHGALGHDWQPKPSRTFE